MSASFEHILNAGEEISIDTGNGIVADAAQAVADGVAAVADSVKATSNSLLAATSVPEEPLSDVTGWQASALLAGVIGAVLLGQGTKTEVNKRNLAIMSTVAAGAIQLWLVVMFYRSRRSIGQWALLIVMALLVATFVYMAVVASQHD